MKKTSSAASASAKSRKKPAASKTKTGSRATPVKATKTKAAAKGTTALLKTAKVVSYELTAAQEKELRQRLMDLREEFTEALEGKTEVFNSSSQNESLIKGDDAEVAEKQRQSNAALQEMDVLKSRLIFIDRALNKMEQGNFGYCEETEEPIGYERLSVIPWARYSVSVQEMREHRLREYRGSRLSV